MEQRARVAILGASGETAFAVVAQKIIAMLERHPWFDLSDVIADDPDKAGKPFSEAIKAWYPETPIPEKLASQAVVAPDPSILKGVDVIISALPPWQSPELDARFASYGFPVVSESPGFRFEEDVPLVVPEINPDHLSIIPGQQSRRGWKGFIVANPVCTITLLAIPMDALIRKFGMKTAIITTLQALSGAGPTGVPSLAILDNLVPFINKEEEKLLGEGVRIFGTPGKDRIVPSSMGITSTCTRVAVLDGHVGAMFCELGQPATVDEVIEAFKNYRGKCADLRLPTAPETPIIFRPEPDRPQPRLDRGALGGMAVSVGRVRADNVLKNGIKYIVAGHNNIRGTAGNTLLNAELLCAKGLLK